MIRAGIIGASGYTGYELIKILKKHPQVELVVINSQSYNGKKVSELYTDYKGNDAFTNYSLDEINQLKLDCIFLALPHASAYEYVPKLNCKIIDLSADYRFKDIQTYESVYGVKHTDPENNKIAVYGLPELFRDRIKKAKIIANPGCYATCSILAALPVMKHAKYIVFDCKSGWSGAGKSSAYAKDPNIIKDNFVAYKLTNHRHKPEIEQFIKKKLSFTPHVIDAFEGMMATTHILLKDNISKEEIIKLYEDFYQNEPFVKVIQGRIPEIKDVAFTNFCHIGGFEVDENNRLVVVSVIDNLLKGASGQAVQNMNIMFGFDENEGF